MMSSACPWLQKTDWEPKPRAPIGLKMPCHMALGKYRLSLNLSFFFCRVGKNHSPPRVTGLRGELYV